MLDKPFIYIDVVVHGFVSGLACCGTYRITTRRGATRSDTCSRNRLDLIQNLVPPHYVYNMYTWKVRIDKTVDSPVTRY